MKRVSIMIMAMVLCSFVSSCVREKGFEDRVKEIVQLDSLKATQNKLVARIQKIDIVPEYNDGSVDIKLGEKTVNFQIHPDSLAESLAAGYELCLVEFTFLAVETKTKSDVNLDTLEITGVDAESGILSVTVTGESLLEEFIKEEHSYNGCLKISDGNSDNTSGYFSMNSPVVYPEAPELECVKIAGSWWAPVNCGYNEKDYPYGKLYQWGRKYGQGYNDDSYKDADYPGKTGGVQTFEKVEGGLSNHPDGNGYNGKFYYYEENWYKGGGAGAPEADKLWNANEGTTDPVFKTAYDPCPSGWRVPTTAELDALIGNTGTTGIGGTGWDAANKGYWLNGTASPKPGDGLFLPAAGYRWHSHISAGEFRGSRGLYWSSSVDVETPIGKCFEFQSYYAQMDFENFFPAQGLSVRCVRE